MVDREVADSMRRKAIRSKKHQGDNSAHPLAHPLVPPLTPEMPAWPALPPLQMNAQDWEAQVSNPLPLPLLGRVVALMGRQRGGRFDATQGDTQQETSGRQLDQEEEEDSRSA
jgi:hypothetical protein